MIETEISAEEKIKEACDIFIKIKNTNTKKFEKLDEWLLREANLFLKETQLKLRNENKYKYKRGTIIKVDFGVKIGSELCHTHFAIVLSVNDNINNDSLLVIPLTSKSGNDKVPLGNLIKNIITKELHKLSLKKNLNSDNILEIKKLEEDYKKYNNLSYASVSQITTISKKRIILPSNKFDIINKVRCPASLMNDIERQIYVKLTGVDIIGMLEEI